MSYCRPAARARTYRAKATLERDGRVLAATIVPPGEDPTDRYLLDVALDEDCDGLPGDLLAAVDATPTVRDVRPQGPYWVAHLLV